MTVEGTTTPLTERTKERSAGQQAAPEASTSSHTAFTALPVIDCGPLLSKDSSQVPLPGRV